MQNKVLIRLYIFFNCGIVWTVKQLNTLEVPCIIINKVKFCELFIRFYHWFF